MKKITIAIDGFSSTGKSTVAKQLAKHLGYTYDQVYSHTELKHGQNEFEGNSAVTAIRGVGSIPATTTLPWSSTTTG